MSHALLPCFEFLHSNGFGFCALHQDRPFCEALEFSRLGLSDVVPVLQLVLHSAIQRQLQN